MRIKQIGYSEDLFRRYFNQKGHILLGDGLHNVFEYKDGKRTDNIIGKSLNIYYENLGVQKVKFSADYSIPQIPDLAVVNLINPEAVIVRGNIYVKADGVEIAK